MTAQAIVDQAIAIGISAHLWERNGFVRVYAATGRKDMKVYLELEGTPNRVLGAVLKVFCETEQHPNWIKAQIKDYRERFIGLFHAYVVATYVDTGPAPNGYGPDINEMIDEARAFVAAYNDEE